jgi:prophage regulatory protein
MSSDLIMLRRKQVETTTGLSRSSIYDLMSKGIFPKPVKLSERSVAWIQEEVIQWMQGRISATRGGAQC